MNAEDLDSFNQRRIDNVRLDGRIAGIQDVVRDTQFFGILINGHLIRAVCGPGGYKHIADRIADRR